ncbi:MAG: RNA polymerase sigma factor [Bacteroidota bacterium]|nr:RNA polymerase sigma factor [Bacteroidota bacterium]
MNELLLVQELKNGNSKAFTQMVEAYQHMVFNTVLSMVQHHHEAEDLAQEVFVQVYQSIHTFRGEAKLSTWLYRIAVTKALDWQRKQKAKKRINALKNIIGLGVKEEQLPDFHHPGIQLDKKEQAAVLFKAMQQLPDNQRIAFILIKTEGLTYEQAGDVLNVSVKAVEALMHRAKENLRKILTNYYVSQL